MTEAELVPLEPLPEDWQRALAIVAHPDDMEYGSAAAVARWTGQGKNVVYCMVTSGEAGIDGMEPERARTIREAEQIASAAIVGVNVVEFLGFADGVIEYGLPLRRAVSAMVRKHKPDVVLTTNFRDTWDGAGMLNQADHMATGRAVLDGVRDAGNRWVFTDLLDEGLEPWGGAHAVWAAGSPQARHGVDVTDTFDLGIDSLKAHEAYLAGLNSPMADAEEFLAGFSRQIGSQLGCRYGSAFEVFGF